MERTQKLFLVLVFFIALSTSACFAFIFNHSLKGDAAGYDTLGWNLASGRGFSLASSYPYTPTMYREPVYPLFLGGIFYIFGHNLVAVRLIQIFIFALSSIMLFYLTQKIFDKKTAMISSVIFSIFPTAMDYPSYLLSETLFTFLLISTILVLLKAILSKRIYLFFYSGILLGITILCKAVMLIFFIPVILALYFKYRRAILKYFIIFFIGSTLILLPWLVRNYLLFGTFSITLRSGTQLLYRAEKLNDSPEKMKSTAVYSVSEYLGKKLYPYITEDPAGFLDKDLNLLCEQEEELRKKGYTDVEIDKMNRKNAISRIIKRPLLYLMQSSVEFIKLTGFTHIPLLNEIQIIKKFQALKNGNTILSLIRGLLHILAFILLALTITGMWFSRKKWREWFLIAAVIIYLNLMHSFLFACARYTVVLIPFYLIFVSYSLLNIHKKIKGIDNVK